MIPMDKHAWRMGQVLQGIYRNTPFSIHPARRHGFTAAATL